MPDKPSEILAQLLELAEKLPADPAEYEILSPRRRQALRVKVESLLGQLTTLTQALDSVRQPRHVFDPTSPRVIGEMVARTLLLQDKEPLAEVVKQVFYGAGVYALYYRGVFDCYSPISRKEHPIYVGKADPKTLHALSAEAQGTKLHGRLADHNRSISKAENLNLDDFDCRYLVVRSAWIETAEDLLIDWFKPVWNSEMKVCYGFGKHGDSAETRKNERSPWDTLHPGRPWAKGDGNTPNKRSISQIRIGISEHFEQHPPNG